MLPALPGAFPSALSVRLLGRASGAWGTLRVAMAYASAGAPYAMLVGSYCAQQPALRALFD